MRVFRAVSAIASTLIVVTACSSGGLRPSDKSRTSGPGQSPTTTLAPARAGSSALGSRDAVLAVGRGGQPGLEVIVASTGEKVLDLPAGVPIGRAWSSLAVATSEGARTTVAHVAVQPGLGGPELAIEGSWRLPTVGYDQAPVGLSANGSTLILVPDEPGGSAVRRELSRFAIVEFTPLADPPQIVELPGDFEFDAVSPDGRTLFVVEHLSGVPGGNYQVRAVDLPSGILRAEMIVDKRNIGETMAGWPVAQIRSANGFVLTLYRGPDHPFVHALDTVRGWAVCIDLPAGDPNADAALDWGLAATDDWSSVFAVNSTLEIASRIEPAAYDLRDLTSIPATGGPVANLAKFGHVDGGPVARRVVVSPDATKLFAAGTDGLARFETRDLDVSSRMLTGSAIDSIGLSPDGRTLFALVHDRGRIVAIDAASGEVVGEVPGEGYDRLLAVMPW